MGYILVLARNCLAASALDYIVMQMRKTNREKGYWAFNTDRGYVNAVVFLDL